jgi:phosphotriesterase-related protein
MPKVETVLGPVEAKDLGFTLSHEHVLVSAGNDLRHYPWRFDMARTRANAVRELSEAKAGGVTAMIDLTTPDLGRNVTYIRDVASETGMHVIVATGIWRDVPRSFWERDLDEIADIFVHEIEVGIEDTGIKAGAIKVANDAEGVSPEGERILRGAARACKRTGTPISTHHWAPKEVGRRQVEIFQQEGAPMDRICIGHSADSTDADYIEDLLKAGVYISMDRYPGTPPRPNWEQRNATLKQLIDRGWTEKLMVGHDHAPQAVLAGSPEIEPQPTRYLHLATVALPALRAQGISEETIHTITHEVPQKFLAG